MNVPIIGTSRGSALAKTFIPTGEVIKFEDDQRQDANHVFVSPRVMSKSSVQMETSKNPLILSKIG